MSASAQVQEEQRQAEAENGYEQGNARFHQQSGSDAAAVRELSETLRHVLANIATLLGTQHCWIAGLDTDNKTLIPIASLPQSSLGSSRTRLLVQEDVAGWVVTNRTPALLANTASTPRLQGRDPLPVGSILCVPLLAGQKLLGTITVSRPDPGGFDQQSLRILQVLAEQVVLAISKARQTGLLTQQAQQLAAMIGVARAVTSTLEVSQVSRAIVTAMGQMTPCDEAIIFSYRSATEALHAVARLGIRGSQLEELHIPMSDQQSVAAWVAQKRRPLLYAPGGRLFVGRVTEALLGNDDLALLGAPLLSKGELQGVVLLARSAPFDVSDLRAVLNLGYILAVALEGLAPAPAIPAG